MYKAVALGMFVCVLSCCLWCVYKVVALGACIKLLPLVCVYSFCLGVRVFKKLFPLVCVCVYKTVALGVCLYKVVALGVHVCIKLLPWQVSVLRCCP